jgi:SNF2 family DNA or RNA helicase
MICGGVSMKKRNEILESEPDVLLMSSAGEASLDCQFATNVINYDLPWNEGRLDQRNGRSAREGQTEQVNIYYLTALDTADLHVKSVVMRKIKEAVKAKRTRT